MDKFAGFLCPLPHLREHNLVRSRVRARPPPEDPPRTPAWERGATIDAQTSVLRMQLVYIFTLNELPYLIPIGSKQEGKSLPMEQIFLSTTSNHTVNLYTSPEMGLESIYPDRTRVFALLDRENWRTFVLFLQEMETARHYRLLKCCPCYDLKSGEPGGHFMITYLFFRTLHFVLTTVIRDVGALDTVETGMELPWGNPTKREALTIIQGYLNERAGASPGFTESCLASRPRSSELNTAKLRCGTSRRP